MVESLKVLNKHKKAPQNAYRCLYKAKKNYKRRYQNKIKCYQNGIK